MSKKLEHPKPPKPPGARIQYSDSFHGLCDTCGSSEAYAFFNIFKIGNHKCINPNCIKYYRGYPSEDIDESAGIYGIDYGKIEVKNV